MRRLFPAAIALLAFASPAAESDFIRHTCLDARAECEETCTVAYGTSLETRPRLGPCRVECADAAERCLGPPLLPAPLVADAGVKAPPSGTARASTPLPPASHDAGTPVLAVPVATPQGQHRVMPLTPSPSRR